MRTTPALLLTFTVLASGCAATVIGAHKMIDQSGTTYTLEQNLVGDNAGPMTLKSADGKLTCEGTALVTVGPGTSTPTTRYVKSRKTGQMILVPSTDYQPGPTSVAGNLRCNDGKVVRCEGERRGGAFGGSARFVGECKHPDRGTIYDDGKIR